ncbi:MAG: DNA repair protein RecN [Candidatus Kapaibacterium sp.]
MIQSILIKDFALIESVHINPAPGLNVIIGETGSGKSMLIDALILAFGGRASSEVVRNGASKSIIEIEFEDKDGRIKKLLSGNDVDVDSDIIILRREINVKGATRNFLNDTPVSLTLLREIGNLFIDFHGQHEHQSLLNSANHIEIFDKSCILDDLIIDYQNKLNALREMTGNLRNLNSEEKKLKDKFEINNFKLEEIRKVNPVENEDTKLADELKILENSEFLFGLSSELYDVLFDSEYSAYTSLNRSLNILSQLIEYDTSFKDFYKELESAIISAKEIALFANDYNNSVEFNPEKIESIRTRLLQLRGLEKKYGSIGEVLKLKQEIENELSLTENFDDEKLLLVNKIKATKKELLESALQIERMRLESKGDFSKSIVQSLNQLGIANSRFEVKIDRAVAISDSVESLTVNHDGQIVQFLENGINNLEFYISTNLGEESKPLKGVASGGEISRIMLSIKNILADKDNISCLIFDEIDTGVSGRVAQMVGISMRELSKYHQILTISHLPQIAASAGQLILIEKKEESGKTFSRAEILQGDKAVIEIAKMMSGNEVSKASIENAQILIEQIKESDNDVQQNIFQ